MIISSRTPEGQPHRCPVCGGVSNTEPSSAGDSCCPRCGELLWWFRDRFSKQGLFEPDELSLSTMILAESDSLDTVELVMELEEQFDIQIPDDAAEHIQTVADLIRYIRQQRLELD